MLLSDIWSRSNFWVTMHTSGVLMSVKQMTHSPSYRLNQSLLLQMLVSFDRSVWAILRIFVAQNGTWNVPGISVSLAITNKASPILSLIEKFAKIAVYKSICRSSHRHPNQLSPVFAIVHRPLNFSFLLTEAFIWQLNLAFKKKINTFTHQQDHLHAM